MSHKSKDLLLFVPAQCLTSFCGGRGETRKKIKNEIMDMHEKMVVEGERKKVSSQNKKKHATTTSDKKKQERPQRCGPPQFLLLRQSKLQNKRTRRHDNLVVTTHMILQATSVAPGVGMAIMRLYDCAGGGWRVVVEKFKV